MLWGFAISFGLGIILLLGGLAFASWLGQQRATPLVQAPYTPALAVSSPPVEQQAVATLELLSPLATPLPASVPLPTLTPSPLVVSRTLLTTDTMVRATQPAAGPSDEDLRRLVDQMPLADKIGQMIMVGFDGQRLSASPELRSLISTYHVGGIVLLEPNAHDPQQIARLAAEVQDLSTQTGSQIPLFIAINHEGGIVVRITEGVTGFPGNMAIAASRRPEYAYTAAALEAEELRAMGINMNLAPVLDVNDNPLNPIIGVRSFGESPELVVSLGRETIRGFQRNGIIAVAKHFPGHGSTAVDSHFGLPVIDRTAAQLEQVDLPPFQMAVEEGVAAIMTAHVVVPAWEPVPGMPASLSASVQTGVLRDRLRFDGIIMADSLGMGAITASRSQAQAAVEAVKAGTNVVISTSPLEAQIAIHQALVMAVQNGEIAPAQIDKSVFRILCVKYKYGLFQWKPGADLSQVGSAEHQAVADEMALAAITLLKDDAGLVPLRPNGQRLLVLSPNVLPPASDGQGTLLAQELRREGFEVTELVFNLDRTDSREATYAAALKAAPDHDVVIFGEWELVKRYANWADQWQEKLLAALQQDGKPVVMVAWRDPGAILRVPQVPAFVIAYGPTASQVKAVVKILTGQALPRGQLPMTITLP